MILLPTSVWSNQGCSDIETYLSNYIYCLNQVIITLNSQTYGPGPSDRKLRFPFFNVIKIEYSYLGDVRGGEL